MCTRLKLYRTSQQMLWFVFGEVVVCICEMKSLKCFSLLGFAIRTVLSRQKQCHAKMDTTIALRYLICEHSSSCVAPHTRLQAGLFGATMARKQHSTMDFLRLILPRDLCHMPSPFVSFIHFVSTINWSVKQKCFKINLYKTLPFHPASRWQIFWQAVWQRICQTDATQKCFSTISPVSAHKLFTSYWWMAPLWWVSSQPIMHPDTRQKWPAVGVQQTIWLWRIH